MAEADGMDAFTQNMLERARQRREVLQKKLIETGSMTSASRKRSVDEVQQENIPPEINDDSPKRTCMRENIEPHVDTPAIQGVRSRIRTLHTDEEGAVSFPHRAKEASPEITTTPALSGRRNRLAALAQNINSWENDIQPRQTHRSREPEKKKTWERPKSVVESTVVTRPVSTVEPVSSKRVVTDTYVGATKHTSTMVVENDVPSKPPRTYEHESILEEVPVERRDSPKKVVSQVTVSLRGGSVKAVSPERPPYRSHGSPERHYSPERRPANAGPPKPPHTISTSPGKSSAPYRSGASPTRNYSPERHPSPERQSPVRRSPSKHPVLGNSQSATHVSAQNAAPSSPLITSKSASAIKRVKDSGKRRESFEPSAQPVSARLASWQQRTSTIEEATTPQAPPRTPGGRRNWPPTPAATIPPASLDMTLGEDEPTKKPVHSRLAAWQQKVEEVEKTSPTKVTPARPTEPPKKAQGKLPPKWSPVKTSPVKTGPQSPTKVGPATKTIHDRLNTLQSSWKETDVTAEIKAKRQHEIDALANRWKNGVLCEDDFKDNAPPPEYSAQSTRQVSETAHGVPAPPPIPTGGIAPSKSPVKVANGKTPKSEKREAARSKLRSEFENKLSAMGFDINSVPDLGHVATLDLTPHRQVVNKNRSVNKTATVTTTLPQPAVMVQEQAHTTTTFGPSKVTIDSTETTTTEDIVILEDGERICKSTARIQVKPAGTSSIYKIIKTPTPNNPSPPSKAPAVNGDYDRCRELLAARARQMAQSTASIDSQSSQYSDTQSDYTETDYTEYEDEEEENVGQGRNTETDEYTEADEEYSDEDYSDEEDEEEESDEEGDEEEGGVGDLLDEAMDSTTVTESEMEQPGPPATAPAPHRQHPVPQQRRRSPSHSPKRQGLDVATRQRVTFSATNYVRSPGGSTSTSSSGETSDSDSRSGKVVHTIDMYRSTSKKNPPPKVTIVRHGVSEPRQEEPEEPLPYIPEKSVKQRLQELQELVNQEQAVIAQTSNALNQCCGADSAFAGSQEAVECHRLLLMACKKREAYMLESQRLRQGQVPPRPAASGSLTLSDIRLPLKDGFVRRIGTPADTTVYYFICMIRHGAHVIVTQMVSTHDSMIRGSLDFPNLIKLNDITQDMRLELEIYGMSVSREPATGQTPKKKSKGMTPKKKGLFGLKGSTHAQSPGGPTVVRSTNFVQIATLPITMNSLNKTHFNLERVPFNSPLHGTIHLRLKCIMEASIELRGFLTMFEDVSGFGAWHRRWVVLKNHKICYWKYPDQEKTKEPMGLIDLKQCITDMVKLIPRDICARPNTVELVTVRRQNRGDSDSLITRCSNTLTQTRHMISADTKEDRMMWCDKFNEALHNVRTWHPDAMRPIKMKP